MRKKGKLLIIISLIITVLTATTIIYYSNISEQIDQSVDSEAAVGFEPWYFVLVGDTQGSDPWLYDQKMNELITPYYPRMMLHVGDLQLPWRDHEHIYGLITKQRVTTEEKYGVPWEVHVAPGNHDIRGGKLKDNVRKALCYGESMLYEGKYGCDPLGKPDYYCPDVPYQVEYKRIGELNPEVSNIRGLCNNDQGEYTDFYSFHRANMKIVIGTWGTWREENLRSWLKSEVCSPESSETTIIMAHEPYGEVDGPYIKSFIDELDCDHNLKLILSGHGHNFRMNDYKGIKMLEVSGSFYGATIYPGLEGGAADFWIGKVTKGKIEFFRYLWDGEKFGQPMLIFSIPGNFTNYHHPDELTAFDRTYEYSLQTGINFVSIPPSEAETAQDFAEFTGDGFKGLAKYENGAWQAYMNTESGVIGENFRISQTPGYLLIMLNRKKLTLDTTVQIKDGPINSAQGWQLLNYDTVLKLAEIDPEEDNTSVTASQMVAVERVGAISVLENNRYKTVLKKGEAVFGENYNLKHEKSYFIFFRE